MVVRGAPFVVLAGLAALSVCSVATLAAPCPSTPLITAVFDGVSSGGNPKGVEVWFPAAGDYSSWNLNINVNGGESYTREFSFSATQPQGFVYVVSSAGATEMGTVSWTWCRCSR